MTHFDTVLKANGQASQQLETKAKKLGKLFLHTKFKYFVYLAGTLLLFSACDNFNTTTVDSQQSLTAVTTTVANGSTTSTLANTSTTLLSGTAPSINDIMNQVSQSQLQKLLKDMTGYNSVTVGGQTYKISERYSPAGKQKWRAYWSQYYQQLGMDVQEMPYTTRHSNGEAQGHNLEAVLPGASKDSIIIIVHYDSIGPAGQETSNPGVDDDMTGMAIQMETARLMALNKNYLRYTVRFVAADYEEWGFPGLEGARVYAKYIKNLSLQNNFKIIAGIDDEQAGWNCALEGLCGDSTNGNTVDIFACANDNGSYNFPSIANDFVQTVGNLGILNPSSQCIGQNSDNYALWEIGVPTIVISEHNPFANPHFDDNGGDTYDKIDQAYYLKISKMAVAFATHIAGIN